jgi:hypothetical protein
LPGIEQLIICSSSNVDFVPAGFAKGHDLWLFSIPLCAFTAPSRLFRLRISNPLKQDAHHESATQQTKPNKDGQRHGIKLQTEPHSKKVSPDESEVIETPLEKSGVIRKEFISVV